MKRTIHSHHKSHRKTDRTQNPIKHMLSNQPKPQNNPITPSIAPKVNQTLNLKSYNTPQIFKASMFAIWGLGILWIPTSIGAIQAQRNSIKTIAKDSIPSVLLAQRIVDAMSDMDAMAANSLLDPKDKQSLVPDEFKDIKSLVPDEKAPNLTSQQQFNVRRNKLAERLTQAAQNITFEGEAEAIQKLNLDFGSYLTYVARAQTADQKNDRKEALAQYQIAANLLDKTLIPTAYKLRDINSRELENQYKNTQYQGSASTVLVAILGLATIGALAALQLFLHQRTRRTLNLMLLGATLIASIFLLNSVWSLMSSGEKLRILKEDSYNSLSALRAARSILYAANSDESRYLLDSSNQKQHETAFFEKVKDVFGQSDQATLATTISNIQTKQPNPNITGHLATAINNITFPSERAALGKLTQEYKEYLAIDQQIRELVASKRMPEALSLCLGKSNDVFEQLKGTMDEALDINQGVFDNVKNDAFNQLNGFEVKATIVLGAMATLVFFGLRPRLKEYA